MVRMLSTLAAALFVAAVSALPASPVEVAERAVCTNSATSRDCWTDGFDINTNFYLETPDTGVEREYWLSVEETDCAPDGVVRKCQTLNGTIPGPLLTADWGDTLTIHVINNLSDNGTSVHWHGIRQLNSSEMDGVPGVTQCPIAPGDTMTYSYRLRQYGSTWYHSHFTFQLAEGVFGPLVINGPASANYDEDLGLLFLQDWSHTPILELWGRSPGNPFTLDNLLINGTNTFTDADGVTTGSKHEVVVEKGKTYRMRVINVAVDGFFDFHIDGHNFTVIATDLVPVQPFQVESIQIGIGQRYDIVFTADADEDNYWIRSGWNTNCQAIGNNGDVSGNGTAILRYDASSTADPTTEDTVGIMSTCFDEDRTHLVPILNVNVTNLSEIVVQDLGLTTAIKGYLTWTLNTSTLYLDWLEPSLKQVHDHNTSYFQEENIVSVGDGFAADDWVVLVIDTSTIGVNHPMHLHGHDFFILGQAANTAYPGPADFNFDNPTRRDVAVLPANGYLAIAFQLDNPGTWLVHCHIAWHTGEGLAMQFVESADAALTSGALANWDNAAWDGYGAGTCSNWADYVGVEVWPQDDSGI
ncbi:hypothetical protein SEUCBS139899_001098 [Sporothrix eucalyptigena]|uniref:Uncharacterized protein n=1 Tax=Sporothrix eucalyptigena TaxID=1812306 RepID=A0ABP0B5M8_9PEZI